MMLAEKTFLVQNGIDTKATAKFRNITAERSNFISMRGMEPNYQISELIRARNKFSQSIILDFIFPFKEEGYLNSLKISQSKRSNFGRLDKEDMYKTLGRLDWFFLFQLVTHPRDLFMRRFFVGLQ